MTVSDLTMSVYVHLRPDTPIDVNLLSVEYPDRVVLEIGEMQLVCLHMSMPELERLAVQVERGRELLYARFAEMAAEAGQLMSSPVAVAA